MKNLNDSKTKPVEIPADSLEQIAGRAGGLSTGFRCPVCHSFITMDIQKLLAEEAIICPGCALRIQYNRKNIPEALAHIK